MTDTDGTEFMRNDPTSTFDAHLFERAEVVDAGGDDGERTDRPVSSICSRTTSYGPFFEVDADEIAEGIPAHEGDVCDVCRTTYEADDANGGEGA